MVCSRFCLGGGVGEMAAQRHRDAVVLEKQGRIVQLCRIAHARVPLAEVFRETYGYTEAQRVALAAGIYLAG